MYVVLNHAWSADPDENPSRRPDYSLPTLANAWLRNAPMFALVVALTTFSIGLCLLAFLVSDNQVFGFI